MLLLLVIVLVDGYKDKSHNNDKTNTFNDNVSITVTRGCLLFVVAYTNSCNNNGHNGCFWYKNNNHDQLLVNKSPTNQQTRNYLVLFINAVIRIVIYVVDMIVRIVFFGGYLLFVGCFLFVVCWCLLFVVLLFIRLSFKSCC